MIIMVSRQDRLSWVSRVLVSPKSSQRSSADFLPRIKRLLQVLSLIVLFPSLEASQPSGGQPQALVRVSAENLHPDVKIVREKNLVTICDNGHYNFIAPVWGWVFALLTLFGGIWLILKVRAAVSKCNSENDQRTSSLSELSLSIRSSIRSESLAVENNNVIDNVVSAVISPELRLTLVIAFLGLFFIGLSIYYGPLSDCHKTVILDLQSRQIRLKVEYQCFLLCGSYDYDDTVCAFDKFLGAQAFPQAVILHWGSNHIEVVPDLGVGTFRDLTAGSFKSYPSYRHGKKEVTGRKTNSSSESDKPYKFYRDFRDAINAEMQKLGIVLNGKFVNEEWFELHIDGEGTIHASRTWTETKQYR